MMELSNANKFGGDEHEIEVKSKNALFIKKLH